MFDKDATAEIYDFCLAWQMEGEERDLEYFKERFNKGGSDFDSFRKFAMDRKWWVTSMNALSEKI